MSKRCMEVRGNTGQLVGYAVKCPACAADDAGSLHIFYVRGYDGKTGWEFNGDFEKPTFRPSMLAQCTLGPEHRKHRCHSFVTDGRIQYLGDCTHALKGQTIDLPGVE